MLLTRIELSKKARGLEEYEETLCGAMKELVTATEVRGNEIVAELGRIPVGPPFAIEGSNLFAKLVSEIHQEMFGILVGLPYFEILQRAKQVQLPSAPP